VAVVLLGVALGNILRGVPIDETGAFTGSFLGLLNPYALFMGVVTLLLLTMHGAAYLTAKTDGELAARMRTSVSGVWAAFIVAYVVLACVTPFAAPFLFDGLLKKPLFWVFFAAQLAGLVCVPVSARAGRGLPVFLASSVVIAGLAGLVAVGLFPRLTPSSTNLAYSLTIYNAASTPRTQTVMLVIALMGMPLVVAYTAFVYWVFRGKATGEESY
jgi:cytochrome d ubiquinol oxidase subunit II